jgi:hypothetical protein
VAQPVQIRGQWYYEQPDGSWLRWSEAAGTWEAQSVPPPPPDGQPAPVMPSESQAAIAGPNEVQPRSMAEAPVQHQSGVSAQGPPTSHGHDPGSVTGPQSQQSGDPYAPPASGGYRTSLNQPLAYEPAPASGPTPGLIQRSDTTRPPADQLIVPDSYVVSTQQRGITTPPPQQGSVDVQQVAPNVTQVVTTQAAPVVTPAEQVRQMAIAKLTEAERVNAQQRLNVLAGCLGPDERLLGLTFGTEQATGHPGIIAVTDRQMLFIGQMDGSTQLFCPLDQIDLVGYEDIGGSARLSVTAGGRVTTWRDIIPPVRAAEITGLVERRGEATAVASYAPVSGMQSTGDVAVYHHAPAPNEIVLDPAPAAPPSPGPARPTDWRSRAKSFFQDLWNDPSERATSSPTGAYTEAYGYPQRDHAPVTRASSGTRDKLRAAGAIAVVLGVAAFFVSFFYMEILVSAAAIGLGYWAHAQNRRSMRDSVTEGLAAGGMVLGGVAMGLSLLDRF